MADPLDDAAAAYQAVVARVDAARVELRDATESLPAARQRLVTAVVEAYRSGVGVMELARRAGWNREHVRRILRQAEGEAGRSGAK